MAKYRLVTRSAWVGTEQYHEIEGNFKNKEDALEAFGGHDVAWQQAIEDHDPSYYLEIDDNE